VFENKINALPYCPSWVQQTHGTNPAHAAKKEWNDWLRTKSEQPAGSVPYRTPR